MSQYWGLTWKVKPGTEQIVEELFRNSGRPEHVIRGEDGAVKGKLLSTIVLMKDNVVVRLIEFEGDLRDVAQHMRRQKEVVDLERGLDQYLETPRDMSTPEGVQKFFREASMRCILARQHDP
jgi:SchA/CurD like domain-containing protein